MITITNRNGTGVQKTLYLDDDKYYITQYPNGRDTLTMYVLKQNLPTIESTVSVSFYDAWRDDIVEQRYVVKNIERYGEGEYMVDCALNLSDFQAQYFLTYQTTATLRTVIETASGRTWTPIFETTEPTDRHRFDIGGDDGGGNINGLELLEHACSIWGVYPRYDTDNKIVHITDPAQMTEQAGIPPLTQDLGLEIEGFTENSSEIITKLYCYGAVDDTTGERVNISSVNGGLEYLEDTSYISDRTITAGFVDDRFKEPAELCRAGRAYFNSLNRPKITFEANYNRLNGFVRMFQVIPVADIKYTTRIIEKVIYPANEERNFARLSNVIPEMNSYM